MLIFMYRLFFTTCLTIVLTVGLFVPGAELFASNDFGLSETAVSAGLDKYGSDLPALVGQVIGTGLSMIGVLFFTLMVYSGYIWTISRGNAEDVKKAKETMIGTAIGTGIVAASYAITNFILTGVA